MAKVETVFIFLASPSDVQAERRYVEEVVGELNRSLAPSKGLFLQVVTWENHVYPGFGKDAQSLINEQIGEMSNYSLFVGIMWNRLGTPTERSESGTVEEFERAVEAFNTYGQPDVWFYFRDSPSTLDTIEEIEQRKKVLLFRERVEANGMPWSYKTPREFRDRFGSQIIAWITSRADVRLEAPSAVENDPNIRVDGFSMQAEEFATGERSPRSIDVGLTNVGQGLAQDIEIAVWLFAVTEDKFTVPSDEQLTRAHFTAHVSALMSGEGTTVEALRSIKASKAGFIPLLTHDAIPVVKATVKYRSKSNKAFEVQDVRAGAPEGHIVAGYDHEPPE